MKKLNILAIDGGGIKGILPGVILAYIEKQIQAKTNSNTKLAEYFDLVAGTSTGGILACTYLVPDPVNPALPRYSADDALNLYLNHGHEIFNVSFWYKIKAVGNLIEEKYPVTDLENELDNYFKQTKLSELVKPCAITAYDIFKRQVKIFNKKDALTSNINDFLVKEVARSTSAAPTYFETAQIKSLYGDPYYMIDGGVFANNPAMCAYAEARNTDFATVLNDPNKARYPDASDLLIVSIGTGSDTKSYSYSDAKNWGVVRWMSPLIDILFSSNSETVDYELKMIYDALDPADRNDYYRLQPSLGNADTHMDNATPENLLALSEAGKSFVASNQSALNEIVDKLIANHS
jgi:patatin-like phospholipase/acyl hydrolase